ncbi:hypothetical protein [Plasmodium yoelii yoelii]|uniref:Uncharacterized protein n=1 Tax=Plasmodium yoelii yoelii TaxID=73239 RepID=Q7RNX7_PLAYO|nr:hypothetical protein [Plasmodium yoelii yoelii]
MYILLCLNMHMYIYYFDPHVAVCGNILYIIQKYFLFISLHIYMNIIVFYALGGFHSHIYRIISPYFFINK